MWKNLTGLHRHDLNPIYAVWDWLMFLWLNRNKSMQINVYWFWNDMFSTSHMAVILWHPYLFRCPHTFGHLVYLNITGKCLVHTWLIFVFLTLSATAMRSAAPQLIGLCPKHRCDRLWESCAVQVWGGWPRCSRTRRPSNTQTFPTSLEAQVQTTCSYVGKHSC